MSMFDEMLDAVRAQMQTPLTELGVECVRAAAGLRAFETWVRPQSFHLSDAEKILQAGWPLAVIGKSEGVERLLQKQDFSESDWGVIHAGALMKRLGARVAFPRELRSARTPDILAFWPPEEAISVEVVTPRVKAQQEELQKFVETLVAVMEGLDYSAIVHLADLPNASAHDAILSALLTLRAGSVGGKKNEWAITTFARESSQSLAMPNKFKPDWWHDDGPILRVERTEIGLAQAGRVLVQAKMPFLTYMSSARRKAEFPQSKLGTPLLVAVDQTAMPMRHERIQRELADWMKQWSSVSGFLFFDRRPYVPGQYCWNVSFHPNPDSHLKLPASCSSAIPTHANVCTLACNQSRSESTNP